VEEFLTSWGYPSIFLGIIATGLGFPMPEELPVVVGGCLVHEYNATNYQWWLMLLVCICGVIVGDTCLYLIGRYAGVWLMHRPFIKKHVLPPERLVKISHNFKEYGVKILLFARLTPGIRAPIFITAGITKLPVAWFLLADGIYAIPGVTLLFCLGWWFTDNMVELIRQGESQVRSIVVLVVLAGVVVYFVYRHLRKPVVEGSPKEMPPVVGQVSSQVTSVLEQSLVTVKDRILHHPAADSKGNISLPPARPSGDPSQSENGQVPQQPQAGTESKPGSQQGT
jgi:membrane protein DedA with SNARE-associated domain